MRWSLNGRDLCFNGLVFKLSINSQWQVGYATLEVTATYSLAIADASPRPFVCQCCLVVVARGLERGVVIKHKK